MSGYVSAAWNEPSGSPDPSTNTTKPLNVGIDNSTSQNALGNFDITSTIANSGYVDSFLTIGGISAATGTLKIVDGQQGLNKVLVSDVNGVGHWVSTSSLWTINNGQAGTTTLPSGYCIWNNKAFADGKTCVIKGYKNMAAEPNNSYDYKAVQYYWDYYKCTGGYWVFQSADSTRGGSPYAGTIQPDDLSSGYRDYTIKCLDGSSVSATVKTVTVPQNTSSGYCVWSATGVAYNNGQTCEKRTSDTGTGYWHTWKCNNGTISDNEPTATTPSTYIQPTGTIKCGM